MIMESTFIFTIHTHTIVYVVGSSSVRIAYHDSKQIEACG